MSKCIELVKGTKWEETVFPPQKSRDEKEFLNNFYKELGMK